MKLFILYLFVAVILLLDHYGQSRGRRSLTRNKGLLLARIRRKPLNTP